MLELRNMSAFTSLARPARAVSTCKWCTPQPKARNSSAFISLRKPGKFCIGSTARSAASRRRPRIKGKEFGALGKAAVDNHVGVEEVVEINGLTLKRVHVKRRKSLLCFCWAPTVGNFRLMSAAFVAYCSLARAWLFHDEATKTAALLNR